MTYLRGCEMRSSAFEFVAITGLVALFVFLVWFSAYNEAATFRKLTGKEVSTWDALWSDLRVHESVKSDI